MPEQPDKPGDDSQEQPKKRKFVFKCTRCGKCCERGAIPLTFWDLELWAKNQIIANMFPNIRVDINPTGQTNLVLEKGPTPPGNGENAASAPGTARCPYLSSEGDACTIYANRPLACRAFPLEYDGKHYMLADLDCPGVGEGPMTKEELREIREYAKLFFHELRRTRIALPLLNQIISQNLIMQMMQQNQEALSKLSEEDRQQLDQIFQKSGLGPEEQGT